jgi:hypothetical protein
MHSSESNTIHSGPSGLAFSQCSLWAVVIYFDLLFAKSVVFIICFCLTSMSNPDLNCSFFLAVTSSPIENLLTNSLVIELTAFHLTDQYRYI